MKYEFESQKCYECRSALTCIYLDKDECKTPNIYCGPYKRAWKEINSVKCHNTIVSYTISHVFKNTYYFTGFLKCFILKLIYLISMLQFNLWYLEFRVHFGVKRSKIQEKQLFGEISDLRLTGVMLTKWVEYRTFWSPDGIICFKAMLSFDAASGLIVRDKDDKNQAKIGARRKRRSISIENLP